MRVFLSLVQWTFLELLNLKKEKITKTDATNVASVFYSSEKMYEPTRMWLLPSSMAMG